MSEQPPNILLIEFLFDRHDEVFSQVWDNPAIGALAHDLMAGPVRVWEDQMIYKPAFDDKAVLGWHQTDNVRRIYILHIGYAYLSDTTLDRASTKTVNVLCWGNLGPERGAVEGAEARKSLPFKRNPDKSGPRVKSAPERAGKQGNDSC